MRDHETLVAAYEDALFALLMERVAESEAERYREWNETLKSDPAAEVPPKLEAACLQTIARTCSKKTRRVALGAVQSAARFAAVLVLVCAMALTVAVAVSPAFRVDTLNFVIEVLQDHTNVTFGNDSLSGQSGELSINWIPEGYAFAASDSGSLRFENGEGHWILIRKWEGASSSINIDTQDARILEEVRVNGNSGFYSKQAGRAQLTWRDPAHDAVVMIAGDHLTKADLLKIAEQTSFS